MTDHPTGVGGPADPVPDPRRDYDRPREILEDPNLTEAQKAQLLALWHTELDEGMSASDPIHHGKEAVLADEARAVTDAARVNESGTRDAEVHLETDEARSGSIEHVVRYVLIVGLILVVLGFLFVGLVMR